MRIVLKMDIKACKLLQLLILLMYFLMADTTTDVQCEPAEIGTNHSISCSSFVVKDSIIWSKFVNQINSLLWQCYKNTTCVPSLPYLYPLYDGKIEKNDGKFTSTLTIYNIQPASNLTFKCNIETQPTLDVCNPLEFFSKPEGIKCNENLIINEKNQISIICFATEVYPSAKMLLNYYNFNKTVICVNDTSSTIKCQSDIPLVDMKVGINFIDVLIYPDVTRGEKFGVHKQLNISLSFPTPSLGQDCLNIVNTTNGYIKQGTPANCTCYVKTQGVPPGGVKWFYSNGTEIGNGSSSESPVLKGVFAGRETNQSYNCVGVSALGKSDIEVEFTLRNAYGPEQLSLSTNGINIFNICSPNKTINIYCSLPKQSVAPEPIVKIRVLNTEFNASNLDDNLTHYTYKLSYIPTNIGELTFNCEAVNSIFKEMGQLKAFTLYIAGPPTQAPNLTIGQQTYISTDFKAVNPQREGTDIVIRCQVSGGFPNTYNMTISCDDSYNNSVTNSNVVTLSIENVVRQLNAKQCVCKAEHATSCYVNNTSNVTLNITYPPDLYQFTANSKSNSLIVSNNSDVAFICDTESNPPAVVEIFKTALVTSSTDYVNFTKKVMCEDSGEYTCRAHNSDFIQQNQSSLVLFVLCSLQFRNDMGNYNVFYAQNGKDAVVKFDVLGFPAPVSYSLFKKVQEYEYIINSFSSNNSLNSKYQFEYLPSKLPYGIISVSIFNLTAEDFINYTLSINNSIDVELNISFALVPVENANGEHTFDILPAAIGGGIGATAFIFAMVVLIIMFKGENLHQHLKKKSKSTRHLQHAEQDHQNSDIYIFKSKNGLGMEINYKNYNDVPITITTATAVPRNFKLKPKPALMPTYFNCIDDYSNEADKSHLIKKEIKKDGPPPSYATDNSAYENNDSDLYANT